MIEVKNLKKTYKPKKGAEVKALKDISLKFEEKGLVFILGKSGSGKSTLLNMLGGLDKFDDGEIIIKGKSSKQFTQSDFDSYRNTFIGFIFQEYNILNDFTVGANIALAMELQGRKPTKDELNKILDEVDLTGYAGRKPNELSGGQKQRVAIARALIKNPEIIMADEPTGALDSNTGKQVFDTLKKLAKDKLVIVVSHDRDFAEQYGDRVIELADGEIISDIKKYISKPNSVSEGISVIEDKIIHIKSGYELTSDDLEMINGYLRDNKESDSFISIDGKTNQEIKKAVRIDDEGNREGFEETSDKNLWIEKYEPNNFKLIRSKLPLKNSLKMAFGSLKKKPFRLLVTIFLSMVAFTLFGLSNTMSSYDKIESGTDSIIDSKVDYASFVKERKIGDNGYSYYNISRLSEEDVENIRNKFPDSDFNELMNYSISIMNLFDTKDIEINGDYSFYSTRFYGMSKISDKLIDEMGYTLDGKLPENDNEIVITDYIADSFILGGYTTGEEQKSATQIKEAKDMIGKTLNLYFDGEKSYVITGILDTKFDSSRYDKYKEEVKGNLGFSDYTIVSEMNTIKNYSYHAMLFTSDNVFNNVIKNDIGVSSYDANYNISFYNSANDSNYYQIDKICEFGRITDEIKDNLVMFDNKSEPGENEIIMPLSSLTDYVSFDYDIDNINLADLKKQINDKMAEIMKLSVTMEIYAAKDGWNSHTTNVKIAGIYIDSKQTASNMAVLQDGIYDKYDIYYEGKYDALIANMPDNYDNVKEFVKYSYDNGISGAKYTLENCTTDIIGTANTIFLTLKKVLLYVGVFFAVFAAIMLMNFIATSILHKKREIGILRAVGARGTDVFMIFFNESLIIAFINWIVSVIATGVLISVINTAFRTEYNMVITLLHFGIIQIMLMFAISIIVAFVASFIPVYKVAKKKPIEAIRKA